MKKKAIFFVCIFILILMFLPNENILKTKQVTILDENNNEIISIINNHNSRLIEIDNLNEQNILILLTIEDKNFYNHNGFNFLRIIKTIFTNFFNNQTKGASTITQQYIKNNYLTNDKTFIRKLKEIFYAIKYEQITDKDTILENYLNSIYFGNDIYGLTNASLYYFNKNYSSLTINEMATLVALLNAPSIYSNNISKLNTKKNSILKIVYENKIINKDEYYEALKPVAFNINKEIYNSNLLFFKDEVMKEFDNLNLKSNINNPIIINTRYNQELNNLKINTTTNYCSLAVNKDGYIISMIGNNDYYSSNYNIVTNGKRDIASTIKPLLYYEALKCGFTTNEKFYSAPYSFSYLDSNIIINNYGHIYPHKEIAMREALATSDNIYAIKMHQQLGYKTLANHFKNYNISADSIPSLALGSIGMSLYELTHIYTQFFTEGKYLDLKCIVSVKANNKIKYQTQLTYQILGNENHFKTIKNLMNGMFDDSIAHATGLSIAPKLKTICYGKSGLSDYDSYMIGFNDEILVSAWSGYLNNELLEDSFIKRIPKEIFLKQINNYKKSSTN